MKYVVERQIRSRTEHGTTTQYLVAINYDPYNKYTGAERNTVYVEDKEDGAFYFTERSAAEVAAVIVGGRVVEVK